MEIKKITDFNKVNEEIHPDDEQNMRLLVYAIQKLMKPTVEVNIQGMQGKVLIDGQVAFTTSGNSTVAVVHSYLSGIFLGLRAEKN